MYSWFLASLEQKGRKEDITLIPKRGRGAEIHERMKKE